MFRGKTLFRSLATGRHKTPNYPTRTPAAFHFVGDLELFHEACHTCVMLVPRYCVLLLALLLLRVMCTAALINYHTVGDTCVLGYARLACNVSAFLPYGTFEKVTICIAHTTL